MVGGLVRNYEVLEDVGAVLERCCRDGYFITILSIKMRVRLSDYLLRVRVYMRVYMRVCMRWCACATQASAASAVAAVAAVAAAVTAAVAAGLAAVRFG